ncbi:hypothetical protein [Paenibacillus sp. NEAU-GSW1]|uniref:hypothetical protein n=1 Tax=Paenibacillus sp. NEAU-GSW1 TaxID=2682486 RepID=UPI0015638C0E|nr:hypothetical protein [Paenibacillus sp. NEAU-GSW1]
MLASSCSVWRDVGSHLADYNLLRNSGMLLRDCAGNSPNVAIKDYRPVTLPLGMIMVVLEVVVYENIVNFIEYTPKPRSIYATIFMVFLPLFLLIVDAIKPKNKAKDS